ncbi:MAG: hypothetical protein ABH986_06645 [archaeon]
MLLSNVFSADLAGFTSASYTTVTDASAKTVTFVLVPEAAGTNTVFVYSYFIYVINPDPDYTYFVKLSNNYVLKPCVSGTDCSFIGANLSHELNFGPEISGLILDNASINLTASNKNAVDLVIQGNLTSKNSAKIVSSGADGVNGVKNVLDCSNTSGQNAGNPANIFVKGTTFVSDNSVLTLDSSGGNGGNGADGFLSGDCNVGDATNGGNGSFAGGIELNYLTLASSSQIIFDSSGGNGGNGGTGLSGYDNGRQGYAGTPGKITILDSTVSGAPKISFISVKGTGVNSADLNNGVASIKGCNLKNLEFVSCNAEKIKVYSNDSLDLLNNQACAATQTPINPKLNCDCYETTGLTSTKLIFSLTGTAKTFDGQLLSGKLSDFLLEKDLINSTERIASNSGQLDFSNGFFNFSFGKNTSVFSNTEFGLGPFTYLFSFAINSLQPVILSDVQQAGFNLIDYQEQGCGSQ